MNVKKCIVCNIRIDKENYQKNRTISENCYNNNTKKYKNNNKEKIQVVNSVNNTNTNKKKKEIVDSVKNNNNRSLTIGFPIYGKTYLFYESYSISKARTSFYSHKIIELIS